MNSVGIVDYGVCNLDSVARAVEECGGAPLMARSGDDLREVATIILPGVGAFAHGMKNLHERGLHDALREQAVETASRCWASAWECSCLRLPGPGR